MDRYKQAKDSLICVVTVTASSAKRQAFLIMCWITSRLKAEDVLALVEFPVVKLGH